MPITSEVLDELLKEYKTPEDMLGSTAESYRSHWRNRIVRSTDSHRSHHR